MKKQLGAGGKSAGASTSKIQPKVRDAIDMELEALRQKVKE